MERQRKKLVLIGNGMAGMSVIEQVLKLTDQYEITVFGSEPYPNYNRIQLSYVLEGSKTIDDIILNPREWYEENGIALRTSTTVTKIDTINKKVYADGLEPAAYDALIIATGSKPFVLPIPGSDLAGVIGFRDIQDCEVMLDSAATYRKATVIGGGLLGLEASKGLVQNGMDVTVVHLMGTLMERQLDKTASDMLKAELEAQGIKFRMNVKTSELINDGSGRVGGIRFENGETLEAQLVVMAAGIKPNTDVARASGIQTGRGIVVDDLLRTSAPDVYAVGECCEHRNVCYGLVAPLFEQATVLAKVLAGQDTQPYEGSSVATKLKISGVDVFSAGEFLEKPEHQVLTLCDSWKKTYKKILLQEGRIVGGILFGDVAHAQKLTKWVRTNAVLDEEIHGELFGGGGCCGKENSMLSVASMDDSEIVCGCNGVTKGTIVSCIQSGCTTIDAIKMSTGATRSCGGCKPVVEQILKYVLGENYDGAAVKKEGICGCTKLDRDEIIAAIREKGLTHVREVMHVLNWSNPEGCSKCRPAINYYLGMLLPEEYEDEPESRFVNERLNANIQKDGTFSVIPRMYGGVTSPEELRKIADIAEKYRVPMVKLTGGQRIDLLGVDKADLPKIWEELDMPSGYGYAKALRTVKTCVGSQFCRFGTQDSIGMGIALEKKFERLNMPAKFKMAVNGCPRNCAESGIKDLGIVGNDGGWELYIGGNGGTKLRKGDLLCKVKSDEELIAISGAFIQYYRENGKYGERTSEFVERVGLEEIENAVVKDAENRKLLVQRVEEALARLSDPWQAVLHDHTQRDQMYETIQIPAKVK
ncbi:nitrite reductase large subunit NirB [Paenibacillus doosanensis]|uniref:nitrite reductase large subunit NirB n=1 Tax=Paenibacillus doosanensis TaxID=1229154 RepID=UPI0021803F02|nr:nitrite reductase large subunit NirB [Paenibacillus doosanensis]MCS7461519.1 nitrite reductase large subunit NirB [Paenibacillus doosanensis]